MTADDHAAEFSVELPNLDVPPPPPELTYAEFGDYRERALLEINGHASSGAALLETLDAVDGVLLAAALHTIGADPELARPETLRPYLEDEDDTVQVETAYALARNGHDDGLEALRACLELDDVAYLCPAIAAGYLARLGDPGGFFVVRKSQQRELIGPRMLACKQLYFFVPYDGQPDATGRPIDVFAAFDRALADTEPSIQWQALVQLRELPGAEASAVLERYPRGGPAEGLPDVARRGCSSS